MLYLITSGAYVGQELAAEFGLLPPAFLPVGMQRLYEYQIRARAGVQFFLTIPESYIVPEYDKRRLHELGVTLLSVPDGLSLGESVVYAINFIGGPEQPLTILHGDTLLDVDIDPNRDMIAVGRDTDGYSWAEVDIADGRVRSLETVNAGGGHGQHRSIACGYFTFTSSTLFVRSITRARGDFISGLNFYATARAVDAVPVSSWLDFGHLQTFFRSRRTITTARAFNSLRIGPFTARKSGDDHTKILAEANWFRQVPPRVRIYCVRMIDEGQSAGIPFYETEYEYLPTLSELFVFGAVGRQSWQRIIASCQEFLDLCEGCTGPNSGDAALTLLTGDKTITRLEQFARDTGFDIDHETEFDERKLPSLRRIAETVPCVIGSRPERCETLMHGDFCFSNILYDSRIQRIKVIDPRGYVVRGCSTIFGDTRYDLAKLAHSISGYYDRIIAGHYRLGSGQGYYRFSISFPLDVNQGPLNDMLGGLAIGGVSADSREVRAIVVGLFLSMLPLHADRPDRQRAFVANALRLFSNLEAGNA